MNKTSRILGTVLGAAIGDAVGHPLEFIGSFDEIHARYGTGGVDGFTLYWEREGKRFAPYTDDTQMSEIVLTSLLDARDAKEDLDATMTRMAQGFVRWSTDPQGGHRGPGNACLTGSRALARGAPWREAGGETAGGCGSVMRAYPFGLVFADDVARAEEWAVLHSRLTHRDPIALAACAAMAQGIARTLNGEALPAVLAAMLAAAARYSPPTASLIEHALADAANGVAPTVTLDRLRGWAAHEAIAAAMYVYARHPDDPRAAILEAASTPGDSDSLATLAGALAGARAGIDALPAEWVRDVERADDLRALAIRVAA
jgi:ADP-ribosylglycohydrolase